MILQRKKKVNTGFKIKNISIPAPVGGLNARDSIANMPASDALILDNVFPRPTDVVTRNGYALQNSNPTGWVETLMAYNGVTANKLFAVDTGGNIRDVTSSSTGASAAVTGLTNARFQYVNFGTSGGHFLMAVNGADKLRGFDGTSWWRDGDGTHDITGVDTTNIIHINIFKSRVWMVQKNSTLAWYLPINSIAGAAVSFDFGSLFRLGGYLMGITTWSITNSMGTDEYLVAVSSEGEVLIYKGYDPAYASTFALAAHFRIGRPQGRRFFCKYGPDVVMITADGAIMLSASLMTDRAAPQQAISNKITNLITSDVQAYPSNFGWQVILYPIGNKLIINVPVYENVQQYQYVMNTITDSWCSYGKQNTSSAYLAACFEIFNDNIYFGSSNAVYQADTGTTDNGANIFSTIKPAFNYFGARGIQKIFTMIKPYFQSNARTSVFIGINLDFQDSNPTSTIPVVPSSSTSPWDTSPWDTSYWSADTFITKDWQSVTGIGNAATSKIIIDGKSQVSLQAIDYVFSTGGTL
ncbi:MAG: hypothetical protein EBR82_23010 [Caulobacteraceae bacterium]|nr:hypothetical protein [Caulobacteraceae bacterium]